MGKEKKSYRFIQLNNDDFDSIKGLSLKILQLLMDEDATAELGFQALTLTLVTKILGDALEYGVDPYFMAEKLHLNLRGYIDQFLTPNNAEQ